MREARPPSQGRLKAGLFSNARPGARGGRAGGRSVSLGAWQGKKARCAKRTCLHNHRPRGKKKTGKENRHAHERSKTAEPGSAQSRFVL